MLFQLVESMLEKDPFERPGMHHVLHTIADACHAFMLLHQ